MIIKLSNSSSLLTNSLISIISFDVKVLAKINSFFSTEKRLLKFPEETKTMTHKLIQYRINKKEKACFVLLCFALLGDYLTEKLK